MDIDDLLKKIESFIEEEKVKFQEKQQEGTPFPETKDEIIYLLSPYFLRFFRFVFYFVPKGFKAAKKDFLIYGMIFGTLGVLFIFFTILWLSISAAFGIYFYENGSSLFIAILLSIGFQIISFLLVSGLIYLGFRRLTSVKMLKRISGYLK